jgi:flagellar basal body-associated protein FliL
MKRWIFIILGLVILFLIFAFLIYFTTGFYRVKKQFSPGVEIKTEVPMQKLLESQKPLLFSGTIQEISGNDLTINSIWYDPFKENFQTVPAKITLNLQDEIIKYVKDKEGRFSTKSLKTSDLKVGDYVIVSTKENKKTIKVIFSLSY